MAYQEGFERLFQMVEDVSESFLIDRFVGGLKDEIWLELFKIFSHYQQPLDLLDLLKKSATFVTNPLKSSL